jgi:hypothetical protein
MFSEISTQKEFLTVVEFSKLGGILFISGQIFTANLHTADTS